MLYYDIVTRFSDPGGTVWAWGVDHKHTHLGMACVSNGRHFVFWGKPEMEEQSVTDMEDLIVSMRRCEMDNFAHPNYSKSHADLLLLHLGTRKNHQCELLARTKPSEPQEILDGDKCATLVCVQEHPVLVRQQGLYAAEDIEPGQELCRYWGKLALLGAHGQGPYCFRLVELDKEPVVFEGAFNCKARRINSFPALPFNVVFDMQWNQRDGIVLMVHSCLAITKVPWPCSFL